jgi:pSer/pThr/pTyr-binding forkhead associated (FHA) protein
LIIIVWLSHKDIQAAIRKPNALDLSKGFLVVVATESPDLPPGTRIPLLPITSIGRSLTNTLVIEDDFVSSEHALLTLRGRQWWLEDLGSRNGTDLNALPISSETIISDRDIISIGRTDLKVDLSIYGEINQN